jgi:hypothetical protein
VIEKCTLKPRRAFSEESLEDRADSDAKAFKKTARLKKIGSSVKHKPRKLLPHQLEMCKKVDATELKDIIKHRSSQTSKYNFFLTVNLLGAGYDYIPEIITFNVWSKVYDMITDATREFKMRQERNDREVKDYAIR